MNMRKETWSLAKQNAFFKTGKTREISFRMAQLRKLKHALEEYEAEILRALHCDLKKSSFEAYVSEIAVVKEEIDYFLKNIKKLAKVARVKPSLASLFSTNKVIREPYGVVLVISPWNYPFQLVLSPLVGAIAAGNCVTIKPSEESVETCKIIQKIIRSVFPKDYVEVFEGDINVSQSLIRMKFDYIFFTGSVRVGKLIMQEAAKNLIPITLELGGKSPCIVDETANIELSAKRIAWGKFLNAGQTCVAPDYLLIHSSVKCAFLERFIFYIQKFYGEKALENEQYPKIINDKHFARLQCMIEASNIYYGGEMESTTNQIAPTLIVEPDLESEVMQEEIFGPIMPVIEYREVNEVIELIERNSKPLALYLFTKSQVNKERFAEHISYGGGCINDTIMHVANNNLPFGGVGNSGMNAYHGKYSFKIFTHQKSVLEERTWVDLNLRYPPYKDNLKWIKRLIK